MAVLLLAAQDTSGAQVAQAEPPVAPPLLAPVANVSLALGVAGQPVAQAWNPLTLELRDVPPAVLTLQIDQGTLRSGEVPLTVTFDVRGGAGVSLFEELLFLPRFATLSWRLATPERVLASGSIAGREADERPLDLVLTSNPGAFRLPYQGTFGADVRLVDVTAALLPLEPAAYDGVRSLVIDGTSAAPRMEAVAAAVTGGALVALADQLPASHSELTLLLDGQSAVRLGAGALVQVAGDRAAAVEALSQVSTPNRSALRSALVQQPLVRAPEPLRETLLVLVVAGYAAAVLLLLRLGGTPGLSAALALAALSSLVAWQALRPDTPQLEGQAVLALAGGDLATKVSVREILSMPRATLSLNQRARPLTPQTYRVDDRGTHIALDRWRSVLMEQAPELGEAQITVMDGVPFNHGPGTLHDVYLVGHGLLGDLAAGSSTPIVNEATTLDWAGSLAPQLPVGTWLARSGCEADCVTWVVFPPVQLNAAATPEPAGPGPSIDPFRGTPPAAREQM